MTYSVESRPGRKFAQDVPDRLISERDTAEILGFSPDTLRRLGRRGEGPTRRKISPRRVGYKLSEVEAYRDGKPFQPLSQEPRARRARS